MRYPPLVTTVLAATLLFTLPALGARPDPSGPATAQGRQASWEAHKTLAEASIFRGLPWREVGPIIQGGRINDIEVVPGEPYTFYIAYASGGLWKTSNNGVTMEPVFDGEATQIMGDIAVDPQDPETIWVGTGENNSSRSSYGGAGVFKSTDGAKTWRNVGLRDTDRIGRIVVDPRDSNRVFVAAIGKLYTPGGERGVFRTTDGGKTWENVLPGNETTGFIDLAMDPGNPDMLYAAAWERTRRPWEFVEGGEGSGIYKSTDGGETWTRLGGGFPRGAHVGRIGLAIATSRPDTVYAFLDNQEILPEQEWDLGDGAVTAKRLRTMTREEFLEQDPEEIESFLRSNDLDPTLDAEALIKKVEEDEITIQDLLDALNEANNALFETDIHGAQVWRSENAGATWKLTHEEPIRNMVYTYGYYFGQIRVAPDDENRIYITGVPLLTSADGGKTFSNINEPDVHVDHHALWVDPDYTGRLVLGNDGGLATSFDGGKTWIKLNPTAVGQFYTVEVDMATPYNIYGGLQDNGVLKGSSRSSPEHGPRWTRIGGGDGMHVQVDPRDNSTLYWGFQFGNYFRVGEDGRKRITPRNKLKEPALRYNWKSPVLMSEHNEDILYFGANKLFRSMDRGETWTAISHDLTRSDKRGNVPFATITTIAESPETFGLLWAGTDDGYVWVTRDGGVNWNETTDGLPRNRWVTCVETSRTENKRAYLSLNGYRDDDITAYVYRTDDLGETWTDISANLPEEAVNVIREDPVNDEVLYVGTDRGAYVSLDRGESWIALSGELPSVPVHDLIVHPRDRELVAGTHGRSVWVIDALPIQELTPELRDKAVELFPLEPMQYSRRWNSRKSEWWHRPEYEPEIRVPYWAKDGGEVTFSVLDKDDRVLYTETLEAVAGMNQHAWNLHLDVELALAAEKERLEAAEDGGEDEKKGARADTPWAEAIRLDRMLFATPGTYTVRIDSGEEHAETELKVKEPQPREPRTKPEPKIRGRKDDRS